MSFSELIIETETVWQRLKQTTKPIYIYGMGDGALKILRVLEQYSIKITGFFASDEFVRGHSFMGYKVHTLAEVESMHPDIFVVMAFGIHDTPTINRVLQIKHELVAPDVPVIGDIIFDFEFLNTHMEQLNKVYEMLEDQQSKKMYCDLINYKLSGKISYLTDCTTTIDEAYFNILKLSDDEHFADLGAYKGDTIEEFLHYTNGKYNSITAFEPDNKNYAKLENKLKQLNLQNTACYNFAAHSSKETLYFANRGGRHSSLSNKNGKPVAANSLDNVLQGNPITFINMDIEGAEKEAIIGCSQIIHKFKPKMLIAAYHRTEDIFALPLQILDLMGEYKFYFRHYQYIPAWDINLYCIPKE